jgi:hypothetical protein
MRQRERERVNKQDRWDREREIKKERESINRTDESYVCRERERERERDGRENIDEKRETETERW